MYVEVGEVSKGEFVGHVQILAPLSLNIILAVCYSLEEEVVLLIFIEGFFTISQVSEDEFEFINVVSHVGAFDITKLIDGLFQSFAFKGGEAVISSI